VLRATPAVYLDWQRVRLMGLHSLASVGAQALTSATPDQVVVVVVVGTSGSTDQTPRSFIGVKAALQYATSVRAVSYLTAPVGPA